MAKKRILLVDDDPILSEMLLMRLTEEGYIPVWESDSTRATAVMHSLRPDLILLDIMMPELSGYDVLERIQEDPSITSLPIMVVSNSGQPVEIERIKALGVRDYIVKAHFSPEEVIEKIHTILGDQAPETPVRANKSSERTVLVVDDDPILCDVLAARFRMDQFRVLTARDGAECLEHALAESPDLILLDILMPVLDGFETLKQLKAHPSLRSIPVIVASNLVHTNEAERVRELGAVEFFVKAKFTPVDIVEKARAFLDTHRG